MPNSVYSFGEESPLKFHISDKLARRYNDAAAEWFKAQRRFNQKFGRQWDPVKDPIEIRWSRKERKGWNDFAKVFGEVVMREGPFHENDIHDDFLVKNVALTVAAASVKWDGVITCAVVAGVLCSYLSRR